MAADEEREIVFLPAVMLGIITVLIILYHYGSHPWALTHTRVHFGSTKAVQQACWTVESRNIFMEWDEELENLTELWEQMRYESSEEWLTTLNETEF